MAADQNIIAVGAQACATTPASPALSSRAQRGIRFRRRRPNGSIAALGMTALHGLQRQSPFVIAGRRIHGATRGSRLQTVHVALSE